jgi:hypothetical protein
MDVVGHQDIGVEREAMAVFVRREFGEILGAVGIVVEDLAPLIAARQHMVKGARVFDTRRSGHEPRRYAAKVKKSSLIG